MAVARSGRRASREEERLGLLEIARARGIDTEDVATLPPGQRDASGFWFPAGYADPMELFTPRQRSMQAKQRALQTRRGRHSAAPATPVRDAAPEIPLLTDAAPRTIAPEPGHGPSPPDHALRTHRPPSGPLVDSPESSV